MDHFAGLDVSVKETSICIVDDTGRIVREVKVASEPEALLQVLENPIYRFKRIGLEAGPLSGDTTGGMLARLSSAVPEGTKIVILQFGGNDFRRNISPEMRQANIASIQQQLRKRGIRLVQADGLVRSAQVAGLVQPDHIHLTPEGYRRVAAQLLPSIH
jgi:lysophospholipase L1-like esterase